MTHLDDETYAQDMLGGDEPVTYALVLRLTTPEVAKLKKFLDINNMRVIYRNVSLAPLYITGKKPE